MIKDERWQLLDIAYFKGTYVKEMDRQVVFQLLKASLLICVDLAYPREKMDYAVDTQLSENVNLVVPFIRYNK